MSVRSGASAVCWCRRHTWHRFCVRSSQVHGDTTTLFQVARGLRRCTETPSSCMMRTVHKAGTLHSVLDLAMPSQLNSDIKKDVMEAVTSRMTAICTCTGSRNLEPSWPVVVKAAHTLLSDAWRIGSLYFLCRMWTSDRLPWLRCFQCSHVASTTK